MRLLAHRRRATVVLANQDSLITTACPGQHVLTVEPVGSLVKQA